EYSLRVGTATRRADSSGSPSESRAGKGTATQAHRKDVSGARVRMPLKNQKEKIRASPWKICFDFFLLIGGGVPCRPARLPRQPSAASTLNFGVAPCRGLCPSTSLQSSRRAPRTSPPDLGRVDKSAAFSHRYLAKQHSALVRPVRTFFHNFLRLCVCAK